MTDQFDTMMENARETRDKVRDLIFAEAQLKDLEASLYKAVFPSVKREYERQIKNLQGVIRTLNRPITKVTTMSKDLDDYLPEESPNFQVKELRRSGNYSVQEAVKFSKYLHTQLVKESLTSALSDYRFSPSECGTTLLADILQELVDRL